MRTAIIIFMMSVLLVLGTFSSDAQDVAVVVINEVAWAGTSAGGTDEWIELYNNTEDPIDLTGWTLRWEGKLIHFGAEQDDTVEIRTSEIRPRNYYLLERTDDNVVVNVDADLIYKGSLRNSGEVLELFDAQGHLIDRANSMATQGWLAGEAADGDLPYASMERINPRNFDTVDNWDSNDGRERTGIDAADHPINGTPKARNSAN